MKKPAKAKVTSRSKQGKATTTGRKQRNARAKVRKSKSTAYG